MSDGFAEKEIVDLENRSWQAVREKDLDPLVLLTDFPVLHSEPLSGDPYGRDRTNSP